MKKGLQLPSDRSFGFTFAVVFCLLGAWLLWRGSGYAIGALSIGAVFAAAAAFAPKVLHPLNIVWMRFGYLLNRIVSPLVMGIVFFGVFAPVGLWFRLTGRDALRRKLEPHSASYWIPRNPPGPDGKTLPRQF